jgi:hypothetical protein
MSIRDCTVPKSPSLMARRAVWRREPNRRRSPRRRRLRRRRSAKPRAERSSLRRVHAIGKLPRVASHLSAGSHASMRNAAAGPADKVDDGGRRRHSGSSFMVCGLGGRLLWPAPPICRRRPRPLAGGGFYAGTRLSRPAIGLLRGIPNIAILFASADWPRAMMGPRVAFVLERSRVSRTLPRSAAESCAAGAWHGSSLLLRLGRKQPT